MRIKGALPGLEKFHDECVLFLNGSGDVDFSKMSTEYARSMHNLGYLVANLVKWGGAWVGFVYLGQKVWKDVDIDIGLQKTLSDNSFSAMVFIMAFLFGSNLSKYVNARADWDKCLIDLRTLVLYLLSQREDEATQIRSDETVPNEQIKTIAVHGYMLVLMSKYQAAVSRQQSDVFGSIFIKPAATVFNDETIAIHRKHFYNQTTAILKKVNNPNKMGKADSLIKDSYQAQYTMCEPNVAVAVSRVTGVLLLLTSMFIAAEQSSLADAFLVTAVTVGTIAFPFAVSASVTVGSFSLSLNSIFMVALDDNMKETLSLMQAILANDYEKDIMITRARSTASFKPRRSQSSKPIKPGKAFVEL